LPVASCQLPVKPVQHTLVETFTRSDNDYPVTGNWQLATGNWQLATGNWQLATGNWQLATGNWQLATG